MNVSAVFVWDLKCVAYLRSRGSELSVGLNGLFTVFSGSVG